jgi:hypothetical protein
MCLRLYQRRLSIRWPDDHGSVAAHLPKAEGFRLGHGESPIHSQGVSGQSRVVGGDRVPASQPGEGSVDELHFDAAAHTGSSQQVM